MSTAQHRDDAFVWHPWSPVAPSPGPFIQSGSGYEVRDLDGTSYVDAVSGAMNAVCGHGSDRIADAVADQLRTLAHVDLSTAAHEPSGRLAERLAGRLGDGLTRTFFANSGSEAIEVACRVAVNYWSNRGTPRRRLVSFERGYHGSTALCQSLSGLPAALPDLASSVPVTRVPLPEPASKYGEPEAVAELLEDWRTALRPDEDGEVAAVVVEPLLNVGGGIVLHPSFLSGLRRLCDESGALLVVDEIFTGFGRTGRWFGHEHSEVVPDLVVMSKGITSGYLPLSAVTTTDAVFGAFAHDPVYGGLRYGHTTSGHAAACVAALTTMDLIEELDLVGNSARQGRELLESLRASVRGNAVVDVRGQGLTVVVELDSVESAAHVRAAAREHGVLVRQQMSSLLAVPPLVIDEAGVSRLVDGLVAACATTGVPSAV